MITHGDFRNLGDPLTTPCTARRAEAATAMSLFNSANRRELADGETGVGSVHIRVNGVGNHVEEAGQAGTLEGTDKHTKCDKETSPAHRDRITTETRLSHIATVSRVHPSYRFSALASLLNKEYLANCFTELAKDRAAGADGVSIEEYGKNLSANIDALLLQMKQKSYRPQAVRRTYIPKENGGKRPLGIPAVEDKMVQKAIAKILEAIYDPCFLATSYGFRKGKSQHDALSAIDKMIMARPVNYVIDADIKKFFDTVAHKWMVKFLEHRINDRNLIRLIVRFLKSGIMEEGVYCKTEEGTPQGGIISPILSNIYLHYVLDLWIEKKVRNESTGYVKLIRFADDFVIAAEKKADAYAILDSLKERLSKFGLTLSEEKTRIVRFGRNAPKEDQPRSFDFLGFTHFNDKTRMGRYKVGRKTSKKKFSMKMKALNGWLKEIRCVLSAEEIWKVMKVKLIGHYRYYGVSGNYRMLANYRHFALRKLFFWLNRRSQRKSFTWQAFYLYLQRYRLPNPKIYVNLYALHDTCECV